MANVFNVVPGPRPPRSAFDLSHEVKLTCDMGELIPVLAEEAVPGDVWKLGTEMVIRFQPLVAPILHEVYAFVHFYFCPYRKLWDDWEEFITGGSEGPQTPETGPSPPEWEPTNTAKGSLWDYFGFPVGVDPDGAYPLAFPLYAYNWIYNEYYRDQTQIAEVALTQESVLIRAWEKDYFTSALPFQQRGDAPALPISGSTSAVWAGAVPGTLGWPAASGVASQNMLYETTAGANQYNPFNSQTKAVLEKGSASIAKAQMDANTVSLASATTFDVSDLRLAFQLQRWLERNARSGSRYTEFLRGHFNVSPRDDRLQRPEYIGGMRVPVIVSEVLQTSETGAGTPQGTMVGHGLAVDQSFIGKYRVEEFGCIIGILSVLPRPAYQQGIDRQWLRRTRYDFYFPEFAGLSEQAITRAELYASGVSVENATIFGYQGRYDEMRYKRSKVCAEMRDTYDYWHLGRQFTAAPELNQAFIECVPDKRIFAVQDEDGLLVNLRHNITAIRPLPALAEPGRIDH